MMDIRMPGVDGLAGLDQMQPLHPGLYVVMMTGYGTSQTSIDAIRAGAFDYLTKPLDLDDLRRSSPARSRRGAPSSRQRTSTPPVSPTWSAKRRRCTRSTR